MEGNLAKLDEIASLANHLDVLVILTTTMGSNTLGATSGGVVEHFGFRESVQIVTVSLGKVLGARPGVSFHPNISFGSCQTVRGVTYFLKWTSRVSCLLDQ